MNSDEKIVFEYLKNCFGENVVFEPEPNKTPDFAINETIAVEVRRLNQHFFSTKSTEGLENLSISLFVAFKEVLESYNSQFTGKTYWVFISYKRPFSSSIRQAKKDMKLALKKFLEFDVPDYPYKISVNSEITFEIDLSGPVNGKLFSASGSGDSNAGGWAISTYVENIHYCITKKSLKVGKYLPKYNEWWLYLVDHIAFGLDSTETREVIALIKNIGNFDKVFVLHSNGEKLLATISK